MNVQNVFTARCHGLTVFFSLSKYFWILLIPVARAVLKLGFDFENAFRGYEADLTIIILLFAYAFSRWLFSFLETRERLIVHRKGVVMKKRISIPLDSAVCIKLTQNPFTSLFRCYKLTVFCAASLRPLIKVYCNEKCAENIKELTGYENSDMVPLKFSPTLYSLLFGKSKGGFLVLYAALSVCGIISGKSISRIAAENIGLLSDFYTNVPMLLFCGGLLLFSVRLIAFLLDTFSVAKQEMCKNDSGVFITRGIIHRIICRIVYNPVYLISTRSIFCRRKYSVYVGICGFGSEKYDSSLLFPLIDSADCDNVRSRSGFFCEKGVVHIKPETRTLLSYTAFDISLLVLSCFAAGVELTLHSFGVYNFIAYFLPVPFLMRLLSDVLSWETSRLEYSPNFVNFKYFRGYRIQNVIFSRNSCGKVVLRQNPFQRRKNTCNITAVLRGEKILNFRIKHLDVSKCREFAEKN